MPELVFPFHTVRLTLENGHVLGEALLFPELSRLARDDQRLDKRLKANLVAQLKALELGELHRRAAPGAIEISSVTISLPPPPKLPAWRDELQLEFPVLRWQHGNEAHLAYVPALGLQLAANKPEELEALLPKEIKSALFRGKASASLRRLAELLRPVKTEVVAGSVSLELSTPKRRAIEAARSEQKKKNILDEVGTNLLKVSLPAAYRAEETVSRLAEALTGRTPRSVLLVGPSGVGKTAAFQQLVRERKERNFASTPFYATSGSRLVAGQCGYGMWQQRCREVCREAAKHRAILHLGNLVELMDVGKSEGNPSGLASFLRPAIARGEILAVAECTPEQLPLIEREDPLLADAFLIVHVDEPDADAGKVILRQFALEQPLGKYQVPAPQVLDVIDRLHRRYATYSTFPGRPLRFVHNLLNDAVVEPISVPVEKKRKRRARQRKQDPTKPPAPPRLITQDVVLTAFTRETGLPRFLLDPAEPLNLDETRSWFGARVIGQGVAVDLIADLIGTVKAGLTPPSKPIASLLFIGPTGVGKTEMAKALAEYLFGSAQRLTRFDMSEYADAIAVRRLVGTAFGAEGLLTAKVREQPFSVILLDEFEKAHSQFFDLLLQMLGEGRLTDAAGRLADFRNSVVILTSNLGAESYQQGRYGLKPPTASQGDRAQASEHFTREAQAFLRPELFNRLDRVVAFAPLDEATVLSIARRQLALLQQRDGVRYPGLTLSVDDAVAALLASQGYEPRYGARPLKRALERQLLAPLAERVNAFSAQSALRGDAVLAGAELKITVKARLDELGRPISPAAALPQCAASARAITDLRRLFQRIEHCSAVAAMRNDLFQLERLERVWLARLARRKPGAPAPKNPLDPPQQARLSFIRQFLMSLEEHARRSRGIEDDALETLYGPASHDSVAREHLELLDQERGVLDLAAQAAMLDLYSRGFANPDLLSLALFSESRAQMFQLADAYRELAEKWKCRLLLWRFLLPGPKMALSERDKVIRKLLNPEGTFWESDVQFEAQTFVPQLRRVAVAKPERYLQEVDGEAVGLVLGIEGPAAFLRLGPEDGLHLLRSEQVNAKVLVQVEGTLIARYLPPVGVARRGFVSNQPLRRVYDFARGTVDDAGEICQWADRKLTPMIEELIEDRLRNDLETMLEE